MKTLDPAILTIFGITGDLAKRKLLPALYYLANDGLLPDAFQIVGVSRRGTTVDDVIEIIKQVVESDGKICSEETIDRLKNMLSIVDLDIASSKEYQVLKTELDAIENRFDVCMNRLFYLAIPTSLFGAVVNRLGEAKLNAGCQHGQSESRLLIEKPFGHDLYSAQMLIENVQKVFSEHQLYRIDHYLAKETVQNILTFRFENPLFNKTWNNNHISHIMITAAESIGIEGRVNFYEQMGALRDIIQSHLLQILALVTMDRPASMQAADIHASKEALLDILLPPSDDKMDSETIRGQYESYKQEVGSFHSHTETFAAIKLTVDSPKWHGVPMFVRTGKSMPEKVTEITVAFQDENTPEHTNYLTIRVQPNEGIVLNLRIKKLGFEQETENVQMDFCYNDKLPSEQRDAYQRVLVDVLRGDKTLFATSKEVLACWKITDPILRSWETDRQPLYIYKNNSWGPDTADDLLADVSSEWQTDILRICPVRPATTG